MIDNPDDRRTELETLENAVFNVFIEYLELPCSL